MNRKIKVRLDKEGISSFFDRVESNARALDRREDIPDEVVITFAEPSAMPRVMTAERLRLLETLQKEGEVPVSRLAENLGRDKRAVSRDISALREYGLLETRYGTNAGHGRNLLVMPSARRLELTAAIG